MRRLLFIVCAVLSLLATPVSADPDLWRAIGWETDFSVSAVDFDEILSGGPLRDGIPSIDDPLFKPVSAVKDIGPREPVIRLAVNDVLRAYPLRVLTWHEIVNDVIGGRPVAVTYCPLCNSAVVFDRTVNGETLEFGVSGLLRNSDLIMYDRATQSWWQQFSGTGIVGIHTGKKLKMIPSRVESFADFAAANPEGEVLVPRNPAIRPYGRNPYVSYDSRDTPYPFYRGDLPEALPAMARVIVVREKDRVHAVALAHLRQAKTIRLGDIVLKWRSGVNSALDRALIDGGRDVGAVRVDDAITGEPLVHDVTFAFVVQAFHPGIEVLTKDGPVVLTAK